MILNGENAAPMLTLQFTFQSFIPKTLDGDIQPIMANMKTHSLWVSINKIDSARKTILLPNCDLLKEEKQSQCTPPVDGH